MTTGAGGGDGGGAAGSAGPGAPGAPGAAAASSASAQAGQAAPAPTPNQEFDDMLGAEPKPFRRNMRAAGRQFASRLVDGVQRGYDAVANRISGETSGPRLHSSQIVAVNDIPTQAEYAERMRNELHAHEPSRKSRMEKIMGNTKASEHKAENSNGMEMG